MGDALGDRMKAYEERETGRKFLPLLPVYARIDGRCFSAFTQGMVRPYDPRMIACMVETTRHLVEQTGALAGYTQSDEISLVWCQTDTKSQILFDGKIFKLTSVLASMTASFFSREAMNYWPERVANKPPSFDCRVFQFPNKDEAANAFLWREMDATKNAVSMAARSRFSHTKLQGKTCAQMQEMLFQECEVNFNDYPAEFKRGTFLARRRVLKALDAETLAKIPEAKRPAGPIERQVIFTLNMPQFSKVTNRVAVLFEGAEPEVAA